MSYEQWKGHDPREWDEYDQVALLAFGAETRMRSNARG